MHHKDSTGPKAGQPGQPAFPPGTPGGVSVTVEIVRGARATTFERRVAPGTLVREVVRSVGEAPEGSAVLVDGTSIPLDTPVERPLRLVVVPTFSGG